MKNNKKILILISVAFFTLSIKAEKVSVNRFAHSHNDYLQSVPFYKAYSLGFASIEADIFLERGKIFVAHTKEEIDPQRTFQKLYIEPIVSQMDLNNEKIYGDTIRRLQLYIDLKTNYKTSIPALMDLLNPIKRYFDTSKNKFAVKIVLSGQIPPPEEFANYDKIFFFDGLDGNNYTSDQLERIALYNFQFSKISKWTGKGRMVVKDHDAVKQLIDSIHQLGKTIRFWATPNTKTAYQSFLKLNADYINTDKPEELADFLANYELGSAVSEKDHTVYKPTYESDGIKERPKNIILLISDGAGLAHIWSAATLNSGSLNILNFKNTGLVNTSSTNDYTTDSGAAGTAFSTGVKTNNERIGVDKQGKKIENIPEILIKKGIQSAIITTDKINGATPASFYAHQSSRTYTGAILKDMEFSPVSLFIGDYDENLDKNNQSLLKTLSLKYEICYEVEKIPKTLNKKVLCLTKSNKPTTLEKSFKHTLEYMQNAQNGFFMMAEGAKIDFAAHKGDIEGVVSEYLDFDMAVAQALEFADKNKNTLVIVVSDHETGGLSIFDGNYKNKKIYTNFSTTDHTGIPVPIFAYGPQSYYFKGFMQNQDVNRKILTLFDVK